MHINGFNGTYNDHASATHAVNFPKYPSLYPPPGQPKLHPLQRIAQFHVRVAKHN